MMDTAEILKNIWDILKNENGSDQPDPSNEIRNAIVTHNWNNNRKHAVLLVHGIGNTKSGDYNDLINNLYKILGNGVVKDGKDKFQIYLPYYDFINDWFKNKYNVQITSLKNFLYAETVSVSYNNIVDTIGDVLWPILSQSSTNAINLFFALQMTQIKIDAMNAGIPNPANCDFSIIAHSMGCFNTYEFLHYFYDNTNLGLHPLINGIRFNNLILMASPIQMIKIVADKINNLIPNSLAIHRGDSLFFDNYQRGSFNICSFNKLFCITGTQDPAGGYFLGKKYDPFYTNVHNIKTQNAMRISDNFIDEQSLINIDFSKLIKLITEGVKSPNLKQITKDGVTINNPHSWENYINRHEKELLTWFT